MTQPPTPHSQGLLLGPAWPASGAPKAVGRHRGRRLLLALTLAGSLAGTSVGGVAQAADARTTSAGRAPESCTPSSGYTDCVVFRATGDWQSFTLPKNADSVRTHLWGGGGSGTTRGIGGAGGYTTGVLGGSAGQELLLAVGEGGQMSGPGSGGLGSWTRR